MTSNINENTYLQKWEVCEDKTNVKLTYKDSTVLYVEKDDFDRAFGAIISAPKDVVERDFAI